MQKTEMKARIWKYNKKNKKRKNRVKKMTKFKRIKPSTQALSKYVKNKKVMNQT